MLEIKNNNNNLSLKNISPTSKFYQTTFTKNSVLKNENYYNNDNL